MLRCDVLRLVLPAALVAFVTAGANAAPAQNTQAIIDEKLAKLAKSTDEKQAQILADDISAAWMDAGGPTIDALMKRGRNLAAKGEPELARDMFDRVILIEPDYAEGWNSRAGLLISNGKYTEAAKDLETALQLEPRHFIAWQYLARIFEQLSENEAALSAYRQALQLHPFAKAAKAGQERLIPLVEGRAL